MKQEENELLAKLKEVNKANSEYAKEIEEINERARVAADNEANPFKTFSNLQQNIADEEKQQKAEELAKNAEEQEKKEETPVETEEKVEEPVEEEKKEEQPAEAPKKKTSLQSLLSSAKNLKK